MSQNDLRTFQLLNHIKYILADLPVGLPCDVQEFVDPGLDMVSPETRPSMGSQHLHSINALVAQFCRLGRVRHIRVETVSDYSVHL